MREVRTASTAPPPQTFAGSAEQIARTMARKRVSPKGLGSAIREYIEMGAPAPEDVTAFGDSSIVLDIDWSSGLDSDGQPA